MSSVTLLGVPDGTEFVVVVVVVVADCALVLDSVVGGTLEDDDGSELKESGMHVEK